MKITEILREKDINEAMASAAIENSFLYKTFFQNAGLAGKSPDQVKRVFDILDKGHKGFMDKEDLKSLLKKFKADARSLTEDEVKNMMKDSDPNNKGKIELSDFQAMVKSAGPKNNDKCDKD